MSLYEQLFARLSEADVRYVVVGGVAVILQGYLRLTADVDLMVALEYSNALRAVEALEACGLRPIVPVRASDFADPAIRRDWIENKNMKVFSMRDPRNPVMTADLFVLEPIPFIDLYGRADVIDVAGHPLRIASIPDLIALKRLANRPQDLTDIEMLEMIEKERAR